MLRFHLLEHLHTLLQSSLPLEENPLAAKLFATRFLIRQLEGSELVDAVKAANDQLSRFVHDAYMNRRGSRKRKEIALGMADVYSSFVSEWIGKDIDEHLVSIFRLLNFHF